MKDLLYLGLQYLRFHRTKLLTLTFAITLAGWLPLGIHSMIEQAATQLLARADSTPLVIGSPGSPLELALGSLYFKNSSSATLDFNEVEKLEATGLAKAIPLYHRFHARGYPIVGTSPDYLTFRQLSFASGRPAVMLGEAVIGAKVADALQLKVGDYIISSPENVFDIAGIYPLKMPVTGVLKPSFSPDDQAIFVDINTSWVIQGLGHGHQDLDTPEANSQVLKKVDNNIVANASVRQYNEITPENIHSFHFHGDGHQRPLNAIIAVTPDTKSAALLTGKYQEEREDVQLVRSRRVISELLSTVYTVRDYVVIGTVVIAFATGLIALLVFLLSLQLRTRERFTLKRIGASRRQNILLMSTEIAGVLVASSILACLLHLATSQFSGVLFQHLLMS